MTLKEDLVAAGALIDTPEKWAQDVTEEQVETGARRLYDGVRERMGKKADGSYVMPAFDLRDHQLIHRDLAEFRAALEAARLSQPQDEGSGAREGELRSAAAAGWNACRKSIYAVCEDMQEKPFAGGGPLRGLGSTPTQEAHSNGFNGGWKYAAKSIARGFNAMEAGDDDNFVAALNALTPSSQIKASEPGEADRDADLRRYAGMAHKPDQAVRICPERDGRCPHGAECSYAIDRYRCDIEASHRAMISAAQSLPDDGWIEWHDRKHAPNIPPATYIDVKYRDGRTYPRQPASNHPWHLGHIIAYRLSAAQSNPKGGRGE